VRGRRDRTERASRRARGPKGLGARALAGARRRAGRAPVAHLSRGAFVALLTSAVEVYKRECLGLLLGKRHGSRLDVLHAIPYQAAERGHHGVAVRAAIERRVLSLVGDLRGVELLGDFHSHPQFGTARGLERPSVEDMTGLAPGQLSVIVAVNERRRRRPFEERDDGTISGVLADYELRLGAFTLEATSIVPIALRCPYALELEVGP
jgi:proteasome lid subunit RPN8/RPN11